MKPGSDGFAIGVALEGDKHIIGAATLEQAVHEIAYVLACEGYVPTVVVRLGFGQPWLAVPQHHIDELGEWPS